MAELSGYGGGVTWNSAAVSDIKHNIHSWSADINCDALEVTSFADAGNRTYIRGLKGWTATCECYVDGTNFINPTSVGASGTLQLNYNNSKYLSGTALLTGFSPSVTTDGVETMTLNFQGSGAITLT